MTKSANQGAPAPDPDAVLATVLKSLEDDQAADSVAVDLRGKSALADHLVIASGRNARHVGATAEHLIEKLKRLGPLTVTVEGTPRCDWVLVDAGDVLVHLFRPEVRAFYAIEKLWGLEPPAAPPGGAQAPGDDPLLSDLDP